MLGHTSLPSAGASFHLQVDTDEAALSKEMASPRSSRLLWTGCGFAVLMLIGASADVCFPSVAHSLATPSIHVPHLANVAFTPSWPALGLGRIRPASTNSRPSRIGRAHAFEIMAKEGDTDAMPTGTPSSGVEDVRQADVLGALSNLLGLSTADMPPAAADAISPQRRRRKVQHGEPMDTPLGEVEVASQQRRRRKEPLGEVGVASQQRRRRKDQAREPIDTPFGEVEVASQQRRRRKDQTREPIDTPLSEVEVASQQHRRRKDQARGLQAGEPWGSSLGTINAASLQKAQDSIALSDVASPIGTPLAVVPSTDDALVIEYCSGCLEGPTCPCTKAVRRTQRKRQAARREQLQRQQQSQQPQQPQQPLQLQQLQQPQASAHDVPGSSLKGHGHTAPSADVTNSLARTWEDG